MALKHDNISERVIVQSRERQEQVSAKGRVKKGMWVSLSLVNLCLVAVLGVTLRSKILFSLPFIDYSSVLEAHGYFAFSGWMGLSLFTLMIYNLLPEKQANKVIYQWILWTLEISSFGILIFSLSGSLSTGERLFSSLYVAGQVGFFILFGKDLLQAETDRSVKLLAGFSLIYLILSYLIPGVVSLVSLFKIKDLYAYRDSHYTFLHFQYNGFFTLAVLALFINRLLKYYPGASKSCRRFSIFLSLSVVPSLFLSFLWHNKNWIGGLALIGSVLTLLAFFSGLWLWKFVAMVMKDRRARTMTLMALVSFFLKMLLQIGTFFPALNTAVFGDRPIIIGFLHLVFLGFVSFYILASHIEAGYFGRQSARAVFPFLVFAFAVMMNELVLMIQGGFMLLQLDTSFCPVLLWAVSLLLLVGATLITFQRLSEPGLSEPGFGGIRRINWKWIRR